MTLTSLLSPIPWSHTWGQICSFLVKHQLDGFRGQKAPPGPRNCPLPYSLLSCSAPAAGGLLAYQSWSLRQCRAHLLCRLEGPRDWQEEGWGSVDMGDRLRREPEPCSQVSDLVVIDRASVSHSTSSHLCVCEYKEDPKSVLLNFMFVKWYIAYWIAIQQWHFSGVQS